MTKADKKIPDGWQETTLGNLPESWKVISAGKYCQKVADGTHDTPQQSQEGKFLVTSKHIKDGQVDLNSAYRISIEDFEEINKRSKVDQWDVLLSMIGTVGEICIVSGIPDFAIKNVGLFKCGDVTKAKWLFYYLRSSLGQGYLASRLSGTTQKYITLGELRNFPVPAPSLPEQKAIAAILSSLDDKIELLRQQNKTLESIAQMIFKEWFIKFKVKSKKLKIDVKTGLPEGWRIGKLTEMFDFMEGPGIRNWQYTESGRRFMNIRLIQNGDIDVKRANFISLEEAETIYKHFHLEEKDMVVSTSGTLGRSAIVRKEHLPLMLNTSVIRFRPIDKLSYGFMYQFLNSQFFQNELESLASGSVQLNFGPVHLKQIEMAIPHREFLETFGKTANPLYEKLIFNLSQIQSLSNLRDYLLPKLMKGEIRVNL